MTFPITPNPGIHQGPKLSAQQQPWLTAPQTETFAQKLFNAFSLTVINAILSGLGLTAFEGPIDAAVTALESGVSSIGLGNFQTLIDGVVGGSGNVVGTLINDLVSGIGAIDPGRIGHVPISAIGNGIGSTTGTTPNLILNGAFNTQGALSGGGDWTWDGTTDRTGISGSGSAKAIANGAAKVLLSNPMAVSSGQTFTVGGYTQWSSLTSTGSPIWLGLQTYLNGALVSSPTIQNAGSSLGSSGSWTHLTGTYTVPAGVDTVRVALNLGSTATAGNVWFDDLSSVKTGLMSGSWMSGISSTVASDLQTMTDYFQALLGSSTTGNPLSSIATAFANLVNGSGVVNYSQIPHITIGGVTTDIQSHVQNLTDGAIQALAGGSSTGNPVSAIKPGLLAIPAGNIVGLVGGGTVAYGATGAGASSATTSANSKNISWSHTIGGSDNYVIAAVMVGTALEFYSYAGLTSTCTYGGVSMSSLGYELTVISGGTYGYLQFFGLASPASGAQTVQYTGSETGSTFYTMSGSSISVSNWSATGSAQGKTYTTNASPSQSGVTSATGHLIVQAFGVSIGNGASSESISSYSQTSRYAVNNVYNSSIGGVGGTQALVLGTAAGAATVSFSATASALGSYEMYTALAYDLS